MSEPTNDDDVEDFDAWRSSLLRQLRNARVADDPRESAEERRQASRLASRIEAALVNLLPYTEGLLMQASPNQRALIVLELQHMISPFLPEAKKYMRDRKRSSKMLRGAWGTKAK
jgi:hypothetical protein